MKINSVGFTPSFAFGCNSVNSKNRSIRSAVFRPRRMRAVVVVIAGSLKKTQALALLEPPVALSPVRAVRLRLRNHAWQGTKPWQTRQTTRPLGGLCERTPPKS